MDVKQYEAEIEKIEGEIVALRPQLETESQKFLEETTKFAVGAFQTWTEKAIEKYPDVAKKLGVRGLGEVKSKLRKIVGNAPQFVGQCVNSNGLWSHRGELPERLNLGNRYEVCGRRNPDHLDVAVRQLLGYVGVILLDHGLAGDDLHSSWERTQSYPGAHYKYGYDWSGEMVESIKRYSALFDNLVSLAEALKTSQRKKIEAEAKALWDKA